MSDSVEDNPESPEPASEGNTDEAEQLRSTAAGLAAKARDLGELRAAVVDAANIGTGLWLSYLFVMFYFLVAVGGVSHRNLLFENPVRLPFLNVDLPLIGFFALGPLIFLIVHAYVLLHFVLLAAKIGVFDTELRSQIPDEDLRTRLRRQLPSNIFVQYLAGPRDVRSGVTGIMLKAIAWISLVIGPIALLVFFQLRFLPYHHEVITWWHRFAIVTDLAFLWLLWPAIARGGTVSHAWRGMRRGVVIGVAALSLIPVLLTFTIATFPGEWLEDHLPANALHEVLVVGDVNLTTRQPTSLLTNRLVLPGLEVSGAPAEALVLRSRHLEGAVLIGANLRKADLTGTQLRGASLNGADLRDVQFGCERNDPTGASNAAEENTENIVKEVCADLSLAILNGALMQGATLNGADLRGAQLFGTQLQDATLESANLQGARLDSANLAGASLKNADIKFTSAEGVILKGATLDHAHLTGSDLQSAYLQAASLNATELQGANLRAAKLQGARLVQTQLQGATMQGAYLDGTILDSVELQGVDFRPQTLQATSFRNVMAWRATVQGPFQHGMVTGTITTATRECTPEERHRTHNDTCDWSASDYDALRTAMAFGDNGNRVVSDALKRMEQIDPRVPMGSADSRSADTWLAWEHASLSQDDFAKVLAEQWINVGCDADRAPYVARALIDRVILQFGTNSPHSAILATRFLDEKQCPGTRGLSTDAKAQLLQMRGPDSQAAPAQTNK